MKAWLSGLALALIACSPAEGVASAETKFDAAAERALGSYYRLCYGPWGEAEGDAAMAAFERRIAGTNHAPRFAAAKARALADARSVAAECSPPDSPEAVGLRREAMGEFAAAVAELDAIVAEQR